MTIKVALRYAIKVDETCVIGKLKRALKTLLDYGTEESNAHIRKFLDSQESEAPLIISGATLNENEKNIGKMFLLSKDAKVRDMERLINSCGILLNSCEIDFSEA